VEFVFVILVIPEKFAICDFMVLIAHLENLITDIRYTRILAKHALSKVNLAP
jgi:hypothetical protein